MTREPSYPPEGSKKPTPTPSPPPKAPSREWLKDKAAAEDSHRSISVAGLANDMGLYRKKEDKTNKIPTRSWCGMCHKRMSIDFLVPDDVWNLAVHHHWQNSVLCINCFILQADEKLIDWAATIKFFPISLISHLENTALPALCALYENRENNE